MRLLTPGLVILACCFASPALAGVQYTQVNRVGGGGVSTSEIMIDGGKVKSTFTVGDNPMMGAGLYMLATGPDAIYMVNPEARKYARFSAKDVQKMQGDAQAGADKAGMRAEIKDFKAVKEIDEAGPDIAGMPTRHYRYAISYQESRQPPGAPTAMTMNVEVVDEFWASKEFADIALPEPWMQAAAAGGGASSGSNPQLQELEGQMAGHGFVLKREKTSKTRMGGMMGAMSRMIPMGKGGDDGNSSMEVTALDLKAVFPAGTFDLPQGFAEVDLFNLMTGGAMPDLASPPDQGQQMPDLGAEPPN